METITEKTIKTYDEIAKHFSDTHFDSIFWQKEFKIFQKLIKGNKVIDIGCGAGRDAVLFEKAGFDYTGIDASSGMLKEAKKRVKKGKLILMDFYNLKFPPETFDGFWAAASILHIPKHRAAKVLRNIIKIIKPNGVGFISVKEKQSINEGIIKENKYGGIQRYFAFYTQKEFEKKLKEATLKESNTNWLCYFVRK
ncbi:MAG: Methyltransferase type 11 [Candidatus Woesebacteria bacterium GW2011_GWB1_40_101]|uniref:Methyltransferase type 11 n=1 Tax=Candidatus Woesebacteria bacterium GW2011_GWB1_40_101 TaxID=1618575 RepID=A0A0G0STD4_9BACT|nr:MAG: Methyltransferase type 11 [Candidatus Woesebacteria bacterium GW2011_GWB1_40_101]